MKTRQVTPQGYSFRRHLVAPVRSLTKNAVLFGRYADRCSNHRKSLVLEGRGDTVLDLLSLSDDADRQVGEYSGGMLQRLGLAAALLEEVPLLVLDEPTLNLDPQGIDSLHHALADLKKRGSTIVFSSHSIHSAIRLADRVGVLVDGKLVTVELVTEFQAEVTR